MFFTSYNFLIFFVLLVFLYYTLFKRFQWQFLLAASIVFYAFSGIANIAYVFVTITTSYFTAMIMGDLLFKQEEKIKGIPKEERKAFKAKIKAKRKTALVACLVINIGVFSILKYSFFYSGGRLNFIIPLGLSFYTFQTLSYVIDAYRATSTGFTEKNPFKLALFTMFFPQMLQGPISRFTDLSKTLYIEHKANSDNILSGLMRILFGVFKILIIAGRLLPSLSILSAENGNYSGGAYVLSVVLIYGVVLYCDFTGGIDIAIGASKVLGITVAENFNRPLMSKSVAEYWRRWHITMMSWFKDYVFFPITVSKTMIRFIKFCKKYFGERAAKSMPIWVTTLFVWFLTGLWHGAGSNFIVWGLLNGLVILISMELKPVYERFNNSRLMVRCSKKVLLDKILVAIRIFRTFVLIAFINGLDIFTDAFSAFRAYSSLFTGFNLNEYISNGLEPFGLTIPECILIAGCLLFLIICGGLRSRYPEKWRSATFKLCACNALAILIIIFGKYGYGYEVSGFIYTNF